jgi:phage FluMu protein Com
MPIKSTVKCPVCNQRLMDVSERTLHHTKAVPARRNEPPVDYQIKCPKCKKIINIINDFVA